MRQKIEKFANGIFSYEKTFLELSDKEINLTVIAGKEAQASFIVRNGNGTPIRGFCLCNSEFIILKEDAFEEEENEVEVILDASKLDSGTVINSVIEVITECGEDSVLVKAEIVPSYIETSIGQIGDLFNFANLAISNPHEAKDLFKTEDFKKIIIGNSPEFKNIYRNLSGSSNTALVLEEFLIAAKKKSTMDFSINATKLVYEAGDTSFVDKILIRKNNWGYSQLRVETVGDFIEPERSIIWTEDFENNEFILKFAINPDKARFGKNYGCIKIETLGDEVEVPIICNKQSPHNKSIRAARREKEFRLNLILNQLDYELDRIDKENYVSNAESALDMLKAFRDEGDMERLYRIYLLYLSGKKEEAVKAFKEIEDTFLEDEDVNVNSFAMFVAAKIFDDKPSGNYCMALRNLYESNRKLFSLLLYLKVDDRERFTKKQRYEEIKSCYLEGEQNVFGLIEGIRLMCIDPMLLKEITRFETACLLEGLKLGMVNKLVGLQLSYVAGREKYTGLRLIKILKAFYERYHQKELLEAVCNHIILYNKPMPDDYEWLEKGVNEQLRIKGLYERCLITADTSKGLLPKPLINYFAAGDDLDQKLAESLYSNIIRFCEKSDNLFIMYRIRMETFAEKALERGDFNRNLAVIYENMLRIENLNSKCIASLPYVLFKHEITTDWKKVTNAAVSHKELREPEFTEFVNGGAIADIFTEDPVIVLLDKEGNRCISSFRIDTRKMINRPDLMKLMMDKCKSDKRVILHRLESAKRYERANDEVISLYSKCVEMDSLLEDGFMLECRKSLINYYYDNLEGELLENQLIRVDLKELSNAERIRMIELMIFRELYNLALKNMEMYGFYGISAKRISRLCSVLIRSNSEQINMKLFMQLCIYTFEKYRPDKLILGYLEKNYEGSTQELYNLWIACHEAGIDTIDLEERLIRTALFTEDDMNFVKEVFEIYYGHCSSGKLVRAYLSYLAYGNLVCGNILDANILDIMRREVNYSENDICTLTLLKDYSTRKSFTNQEKNFIEYQIKKMEAKGRLLPFFKDFPSDIRVPKQMRDKYYVEYHTESNREVKINYCLVGNSTNDNFREEEMKDVGFGIYVKEFILFYGEIMQYYITENSDNKTAITESREVSLGPEHFGREECRYHQINLIITAKEMNDEKTVIKLIENYQFNDYAVKRLFESI
ncbi:MAG: hypothetical protein IKP88_18500 [Lachnospiraceae bacterium]|nr:hypothetical protein [Lachnospiraceae bacterium]